jgi:universal stress protein E
MPVANRILVIVDKPKHEQTALRRALDLQTRTQAHLHLASFAYLPMYDQKDIFDAHQRRAIRNEAVRQRSEWLRGQLADASALARDLDTEVVWEKDIAGWVTNRVAEARDDLVVKSIHQSQTLLHTPLDWQLLRQCPVPVLLCTPRPWRRKPRVLAALDLRVDDKAHATLNRKVLEAARGFAEVHGGELHCVYALLLPHSASEIHIPDARRFRADAVERARERMAAMAADYDVPMGRLHVPLGKVGFAVNGVAAKVKADLLVMGTTARRGLAGMVIGNSAEKVLTRAQCDVLALKP